MYKLVGAQIVKQRMNFIGFHTYPYRAGQATGTNEPAVWVGVADNVNSDGTVTHSYPTAWANTLRGQWGNEPMATSEYAFGASQLFDADCYGNAIQKGNCPFPTTPAGNNAVFNAVGTLFNRSFTCVRSVVQAPCPRH